MKEGTRKGYKALLFVLVIWIGTAFFYFRSPASNYDYAGIGFLFVVVILPILLSLFALAANFAEGRLGRGIDTGKAELYKQRSRRAFKIILWTAFVFTILYGLVFLQLGR